MTFVLRWSINVRFVWRFRALDPSAARSFSAATIPIAQMFIVLRQVLIGLVVVLLQWLVFGRLPLWGVVPDIVLLFVALTAIRYGRLSGAIAGFSAGLLMDILVNPHLLGLNAVLKTLLGFTIGFFRSDQGDTLRLVPFQAFFGALVVAVVHNGLMVIMLALDQSTRTLFLVVGLWLGAALYTAVAALVGSLFRRG